jgi:hypothetical protein
MMKLRSDYKDKFVEKHGVKLGLMSCFVKVTLSDELFKLYFAVLLTLAFAGCCFGPSKSANS